MVVLPCILVVSVLLAETKASGWTTYEVIPAKEDASCPEGMNITCNSIIDKNGTILRYERGNVTDDSTLVPGKDCPWKIRAPRGTTILYQTSCYHHFYVGNNQTEYEVCFTQASASDPTSLPFSSCAIRGYTKNATAPINEFDLYVSYKNGKKYALGFTIKISFLGTPLPEIATTVTASTTTVPASATTVPASTMTVPASTTTVPASTTTVPASATTVPASTTTVPASTTTMPASATTVPASTATMPASITTVPASTTAKMTTTSDASRTLGNFVLLVLVMFGILHFA